MYKKNWKDITIEERWIKMIEIITIRWGSVYQYKSDMILFSPYGNLCSIQSYEMGLLWSESAKEFRRTNQTIDFSARFLDYNYVLDSNTYKFPHLAKLLCHIDCLWLFRAYKIWFNNHHTPTLSVWSECVQLQRKPFDVFHVFISLISFIV